MIGPARWGSMQAGTFGRHVSLEFIEKPAPDSSQFPLLDERNRFPSTCLRALFGTAACQGPRTYASLRQHRRRLVDFVSGEALSGVQTRYAARPVTAWSKPAGTESPTFSTASRSGRPKISQPRVRTRQDQGLSNRGAS